MAVQLEGYLELSADAVSAADEHGLFDATRKRAQAGKATNPVEDEGRSGCPRQGFDAVNQRIAALNAHARVLIRNRHGALILIKVRGAKQGHPRGALEPLRVPEWPSETVQAHRAECGDSQQNA